MEELCAEWGDDARMNALFAPLRNKDVNPESWHSKIQFWLNLVEKWSSYEGVLVLDIELLKKTFSRKGKSVQCLEDVIKEGLGTGLLAKSDGHLQSLDSAHQSWGTWMLELGTGAVKSVGSKLIGSSNPGTITVIKTLNLMKEKVLSDLLVEENYIECRYDVIIREEQVMTVLKSIKDEKSRDYLLQVLLADRKLVKFSTNNKNFYKVIHNSKNKQFDEIDQGLVRLKLSIQHLGDKIKDQEEKHKKEKENVKKYLIEGKRNSAKTCLKRIKRFEESLSKMLDQQSSLEHLFLELQNAENNKILMEAYETGLATMKTMVTPEMLEKSENTMLELAELIDVNKEIGESLSTQQVEIENESLDEELEILIKDMEKETEKVEKPKNDKSTINIKSPDGNIDMALSQLNDLNLDDLEPLIPTKIAKKEAQIMSS